MTKFNSQCAYWIVLLCIHLPLRSGYHATSCMGKIGGGEHSIGKGAQVYHSHKLADPAAGDQRCFDSSVTLQNTWTPNYILYNSTDFHDTADGGNNLFGWISLSITVQDGLDTFMVHPSVPKDNVQFTPGEIVRTRLGGSCQDNLGGQPFPKENLAPCYFVPDPSTTVGVGAAYVGSRVTNLRVTFRTDFPECAAIHENSDLEFRFFANRQRPAQTTCNGRVRLFTAPQNKLFVKDITYGGYDPDPPRESDKVSCDTHLNSAKGWVLKYAGSVLDSSNAPVFLNGPCYAKISNQSSFTGRCSYVNSGTSSEPTNTYKCNPQTLHKDGVDFVPENPPGGGSCQGCVMFRNRTRKLGVPCASSVGQHVWGLRTTHGVAMAWTAMAVIPLSTLMSRYYKETFMKHRYVNVHVWHGVHAATALTGFAGLLSGWVAALVGRLYFGFCKSGVAYVHWSLGYLSILSFLLAFFGSSVRIFDMRWRLLTIFFHFLAGTIARICWTVCLLTSIYIPGSPAAGSDTHISGFTFEPAVVIIIAWVIVDVAVHVFLMVKLKSKDIRVSYLIKRTYAIAVPIPLIRPEETKDIPGARLKKISLILHTVVGVLCALLLSVLICLQSPEGRFFGRMWYTHKASGKLNMLMNGLYYD